MFVILAEVVPFVQQELVRSLPESRGWNFLETAKAFMRHSVSVARRGVSVCGSCASYINHSGQEQLPAHCPNCGIEWRHLLPCFLYFALGSFNNTNAVKKSDENYCKELAPHLTYTPSVALTYISPATRPGYDINDDWQIIT
ncbi:MAG TPA: hypothetical protein VFH06_05140 [Candidatus Saccharimonadales bacterium]|nr:hypothetical protein [Candidatus Saccharimonadales bacterium]